MILKAFQERHIDQIIIILILTTLFSWQTSDAQEEIIYLAPGESAPIIQQLGSNAFSLSVQVPMFSEWSLYPGQDINEISGVMTIITPGKDDPWSVIVLAGTENNGILCEYDNAKRTYVDGGQKLDSPLQIVAEGGKSVNLATGGLLISGIGPDQVAIKLRQAISYDILPLSQGHTYGTSIAFAISPGLQ